MLTLTEDATTAVRQIVSAPGVPSEAGLRISAAVTEDRQSVLELSVAEASQPTDQIIGDGDIRVFVDEQVAPLLDDKTLDATVDAGQIRFTVLEQPPSG